MKFEDVTQVSLAKLIERTDLVGANPPIQAEEPITWSQPMTGDQLEERMRRVIGIAGNE